MQSEWMKTRQTKYTLYVTVYLIVIVAILGVLLNVWLRRGDRKIQSKLADVRDRHQPFNIEPAEEAPVDSAPPQETPPQA